MTSHCYLFFNNIHKFDSISIELYEDLQNIEEHLCAIYQLSNTYLIKRLASLIVNPLTKRLTLLTINPLTR